MKNNKRKFVFWCLLFVFLSLSFNFAKQIANQLKLARELKEKKSELSKIKEKNKQLRAKLEEIRWQPTITDVPNQILKPSLPNYKKWFRLFWD